ncbi:MAG: PAS domain S-box protein [Microcoleus sp. PH2017_10_PVI_O_A]|uniref:PAS domain S-box protein n=1 Tax=unclassified Microcoleus TaxID=2642155 RepID=UPI001D73AF94|nr:MULTISPECIES: PAS domain S-box protein [unclassified Microcoleus]TAE79345.1 MAG: PAS domain S-box protein [Oscillatoriales cyanobacterium]MCC3408402.1 PAS domain S-box protein [Microcoleus sp. PH2017_10_PVI_O_A]MCC3462463.1 PAS domain S-box protein [Microcoleus sp. PH2017_11_PCY_U_A]MCC3480926.1 PAS domain S-box protein [Microcoleus sp. PH2017_12_PCY_D_A]MCC3531020.1 PAS domain S-box protein [Microcoleus sp. PH2017_21_RUC_O_A]
MKKPVIICVDDEQTILDSLEIDLLKAFEDKYLIETAQSGEEALELLSELLAEQYEVPLVISDHIMPNMKGDELLRSVHAISPRTLKIMLTGQADLEAVANAINYAKLYRYIPKPWQTDDLKLTVTEAIYRYFQDKQLAEKQIELLEMNQELARLNRKQAMLIAKLHENESRLTQYLEAMPLGVCVLDANGQSFYANQKAREVFGRGTVPHINAEQKAAIYQFYKAGTNQRCPVEELPIMQALRGESVRTESVEIRTGNKVIPVESWATPIYDSLGDICYGIIAFTDITERKQAEAALVQAEEKYRRIFENALEGIFQTSPDGTLISANPALAQIYGYDSAEELMASVNDFQRQLYVQPNRRQEFFALMEQCGTVSEFESEVYRRDGSIIWISEDARTVFDARGELLYYQGFAEDITLRRLVDVERLKFTNDLEKALIAEEKFNEALLESENRLTQLLEAVPVGIFVVDGIGKPCYMNSWAEKILGKGLVSDVIPTNLPEVYQTYCAGTNELYPGEMQPIVRALRGEVVHADDAEIHQPQRIVPIEVWATPIYDERKNIVYAIAVFQDITERQELETERRQFTNELEKALAAEEKLTDAYGRFVPHQFLHFLGYESILDVKLGDQVQKEMSVLFSDIRNFTALSEMMSPEENFQFINAYLSRMEPAITENFGFIDKYIGDAIMALFNGSADDAVKAGIAMLEQLSEYNMSRSRPDRAPLQIGIGINTGSLMLGTVGGQSRMDSTVISDAVNLASRVESLTKEYGVSMLITHNTFVQLNDVYDFRLIDRVTVKGKSRMVTVYEVFTADPPELRQKKLETKTMFEQGLVFYNSDKFLEATRLFSACLQVNPGDKVAQIYMQRCVKRPIAPA